MRDLARFQRSFGRALLKATQPDEIVYGQALDVALRIHRNTSMKGWVDALAANYPTIVQLVGEEWFKGCSLEFAYANPARSPVLALYGERFPEFLSSFPPAKELPYLAEVARLDRLWIESYFAQDAPTLPSTGLAGLPADALSRKRVSLHPATRFAWVAHSAATIWTHQRATAIGTELTVADDEEGILLTRLDGKIEFRAISRVAYDFLVRLTCGDELGHAAEAVLESDPAADVATVLATTLAAGAFAVVAEIDS